jgi:hypothetical protein
VILGARSDRDLAAGQFLGSTAGPFLRPDLPSRSDVARSRHADPYGIEHYREARLRNYLASGGMIR